MTPTPESSRPKEEAWVELQGFVAQIDRLARTTDSSDLFFRELLDQLIPMLSAVGGAIWQCTETGELSLECSKVYAEREANWDFDPDLHCKIATLVAQQGAIRYLAPGVAVDDAQLCNEGPFGLYVAPILVGQMAVGVIELIQRPETSPSGQRGHERLLRTLTEIAGDLYSRLDLERLRHAHQHANNLLDLVASVGAERTLAGAAERIVERNDLIGYDRTSIHIRKGLGFRLVSVSGMSRFEGRSNAVRSLTRLVNAYRNTAAEAALHFPTDTDQPCERRVQHTSLEDLVAEHKRTTGATHVSLVPLKREPNHSLDVVLVGENFEPSPDSNLGMQLTEGMRQQVLEQASVAIHKALDVERIPFAATQRWIGEQTIVSWFRHSLRILLPVSVLLCFVLTLTKIKTDFTVSVQGELRPAITREIFAPADGEVVELLVKDGDEVSIRDTLIRLSSPSLDLQFQQALGEFETTRKRLDGISSSRVQISTNEPNTAIRLSQLSASEEELKQHLISKRRELNLLRAQRKALTLTSPIDGQVITWDATRMLENRPVRRGQALLAIADQAGDWLVHWFVSQRDIGYLQTAASQDKQINADFYLATKPNVVLHAVIVEIAKQVEWNEEMKQHVVRVTAQLPANASNEFRTGSAVYGKIACGKRSIAYAWLHDAIEKLRGEWLLFTSNRTDKEKNV